MRKLFLLTALFCATVMGFATQYCHEELTNGDNKIYLTCQQLSEGNYQIKIEADVQMNGLGGSFGYKDGQAGYQLNANGHFELSDDGKTIICDIESTSAPNLYTPLYVLMPGEVAFGWPNDVEWGLCSGTEAKTNPELSLNATDITLDAATSETFQIVATRQGDGAISYESANEGIATVSADGLVTAVGRGKAVITVRVAETDTYAAANKKLNVTVDGPINWDAIAWLPNGSGNEAYTNKYKACAGSPSPNIDIIQLPNWEGVTGPGIYVNYPSAVFTSFPAMAYYQQGAGLLFYMTNFTEKYTEVVVGVDNTDYSFTVYYADGKENPSALDNISVQNKAHKVIENGQVVIIKNGLRYNLLGSEIK